MSKFRKGGKKTMAAISTASLPDIVFMLLFFFMVTTVMRETELKVELKTPTASEIVKIKNKSEISTIYIGKPTQSIYDKNSTKIQLNDRISNTSEIYGFIEQEKGKKSKAALAKYRVQIKADSDAEMGIITDVKTELRKADALRINYSTNEKKD